MRGCAAAFEVRLCVTGQHRQMLDQVLEAFGVTPDHDLDVMRGGQTLGESTSRMMAVLEPVIAAEWPHMVIVQGDTTTTSAGLSRRSISESRSGT